MSMKELLLSKIEKKEIVCGIVGIGYVGLPLAVEQAKAGFRVIGFDVSQGKVDLVNSGKNYIGDVNNEDLSSLVASGQLRATTDFGEIGKVDFVAICVPTPLDPHQQPDIAFVRDAAIAVGKNMKKETMVVLESTTYPGTTEELLKPILEKESGLTCGIDFYLGFSPERVDPGNPIFKTKNTPKVVGAIGPDAQACIAAMYKAVLGAEIHEVSSPAVAEMEKILENAYRNINIGLVNELAKLCHKMGISIWEVIDAAKTKPYGFQAFYPGPGLGGHCIPLDPYYLAWKAREFGFHTSMIESSMIINDSMPEYTIGRISDTLNRYSKSMRGARVLHLGVAYKNDIDDCRESPSIVVGKLLRKEGCLVDYFDPWVASYREGDEVLHSLPELTAEIVKEYDIVVITTAHTNVDYDLVCANAKAVFDCKNATKNVTANRDNIEVL